MLDYRMSVSLDLPMIDTVTVEVANAIHSATGVRVTQMPMLPGRIMAALWDNEASKGNGQR